MAARTMLCGTIACSLGVLLTLGITLTGRVEASSRAKALLPSKIIPVVRYTAFITEASHRFAIPARWILAVIQVESDGNAHGVSSRGALGLMQIMPQTWVELSVRYGLGIDPFDPHDNIAAGTAYLREMLDRFGLEGFLAAYNAGPKRYEEHLITGRPFPEETKTYVAKLAAVIGIEQRERGAFVIRRSVSWQRAPVFVVRSDGSSADGDSTSAAHSLSAPKDIPGVGALALVPRPTGLFVRRSNEVQS